MIVLSVRSTSTEEFTDCKNLKLIKIGIWEEMIKQLCSNSHTHRGEREKKLNLLFVCVISNNHGIQIQNFFFWK